MFKEALYITETNKFEIRDYNPGISLPDYEVRIKVKWVGICGSDLSTLENHSQTELSLGHEWIGEVTQAGKLVKHKKVGDFVTSTVFVKCGYCSPCEANLEPCLNQFSLTDNKGMLKEVVFLPEKSLVKVPGPKNASSTLYEILAVAENIFTKTHSRLKKDDQILVMGAGLLGLSVGLVLQREGFNFTMIETIPSRIKRAKSLGFNCLHLGGVLLDIAKLSTFHFIYDATGDHLGGKGGWNYYEHLGKKGFTAIILAKYINSQNLKTDKFFNKQATLEWIQGCTEESLIKAIEKWESTIEELGKTLITHNFKLNEVNEAFAMAKNREVSARVIIEIN